MASAAGCKLRGRGRGAAATQGRPWRRGARSDWRRRRGPAGRRCRPRRTTDREPAPCRGCSASPRTRAPWPEGGEERTRRPGRRARRMTPSPRAARRRPRGPPGTGPNWRRGHGAIRSAEAARSVSAAPTTDPTAKATAAAAATASESPSSRWRRSAANAITSSSRSVHPAAAATSQAHSCGLRTARDSAAPIASGGGVESRARGGGSGASPRAADAAHCTVTTAAATSIAPRYEPPSISAAAVTSGARTSPTDAKSAHRTIARSAPRGSAATRSAWAPAQATPSMPPRTPGRPRTPTGCASTRQRRATPRVSLAPRRRPSAASTACPTGRRSRSRASPRPASAPRRRTPRTPHATDRAHARFDGAPAAATPLQSSSTRATTGSARSVREAARQIRSGNVTR